MCSMSHVQHRTFASRHFGCSTNRPAPSVAPHAPVPLRSIVCGDSNHKSIGARRSKGTGQGTPGARAIHSETDRQTVFDRMALKSPRSKDVKSWAIGRPQTFGRRRQWRDVWLTILDTLRSFARPRA